MYHKQGYIRLAHTVGTVQFHSVCQHLVAVQSVSIESLSSPDWMLNAWEIPVDQLVYSPHQETKRAAF